MLYEAMVGALPFDGENLEAVMRAIVAGHFKPLREWERSLPESVAAMIERAIARERELRFATMQDFVDAAIGCLGESPVGVGRIRAMVALPRAVTAEGSSRSGRWRTAATAMAWLATVVSGGQAGGVGSTIMTMRVWTPEGGGRAMREPWAKQVREGWGGGREGMAVRGGVAGRDEIGRAHV